MNLAEFGIDVDTMTFGEIGRVLHGLVLRRVITLETAFLILDEIHH